MSRLKVPATALGKSPDVDSLTNKLATVGETATAQVFVRNADGTSGASTTVYADPLSPTVIPQPISADTAGRFPGWVEDGSNYNVEVTLNANVWAEPFDAAGSVADATSLDKGKVRLAGDITGSADVPTVVEATPTSMGKVQLAGMLAGNAAAPIIATTANPTITGLGVGFHDTALYRFITLDGSDARGNYFFHRQGVPTNAQGKFEFNYLGLTGDEPTVSVLKVAQTVTGTSDQTNSTGLSGFPLRVYSSLNQTGTGTGSSMVASGFYQEVLSARHLNNEFAYCLGVTRDLTDTAANGKHPLIWGFDSGVHGCVGGQNEGITNISSFINNYFNGTPQSYDSSSILVTTRKAFGPSQAAPHSTADTYPVDVGMHIVGRSTVGGTVGTNYTDGTHDYGFRKAIRIGGGRSYWWGTALSRFHTGVDIADWGQYGLVIGDRYSGAAESGAAAIRILGTGTASQIGWGGNANLYSTTTDILQSDGLLLAKTLAVWGTAGTGYMNFIEQSTPATTPAADKISLYAADNGGTTVLRTKDSAGNIVTLGAGGGGYDQSLNTTDTVQFAKVGLGQAPNTYKLSFVASATTTGGIDFGGDTNLYRSAAGTLKTDGVLFPQAVATHGTAGAGYVSLLEQSSAPTGPAADSVRLYAVDDGSGRTAFKLRDNTGVGTVRYGPTRIGIDVDPATAVHFARSGTPADTDGWQLGSDATPIRCWSPGADAIRFDLAASTTSGIGIKTSVGGTSQASGSLWIAMNSGTVGPNIDIAKSTITGALVRGYLNSDKTTAAISYRNDGFRCGPGGTSALDFAITRTGVTGSRVVTIDDTAANGVTLTFADGTQAAALKAGTTFGLKLGTAATELLGIYGAAPVARAADYTVTTSITTHSDLRSFDEDTVTLGSLARVVATLIKDDQALGLRGGSVT